MALFWIGVSFTFAALCLTLFVAWRDSEDNRRKWGLVFPDMGRKSATDYALDAAGVLSFVGCAGIAIGAFVNAIHAMLG